MKKKKRNIKILFGKEGEIDAEAFNAEFWKNCPDSVKFDIAWDMVVQSYITKGKDPNELRLRRDVIPFKPA